MLADTSKPPRLRTATRHAGGTHRDVLQP